MKVKLSKWGNSLAVRIPSPVVDEAQLKEGESMDIATIPNGGVRLIPVEAPLTIEDLVSEMTDKNLHNEVDWGQPVGNEVW